MKSDDELKKINPELYKVAREKGTETPFTGKYVSEKSEGVYKCAICGQKLFNSDAKFDSGTGWPSFTNPANRENVILMTDGSHGMARTEVKCANCGAHLGHVFSDGPFRDGKVCDRFCINSISLNLEKE